jgi:hypothetical protein
MCSLAQGEDLDIMPKREPSYERQERRNHAIFARTINSAGHDQCNSHEICTGNSCPVCARAHASGSIAASRRRANLVATWQMPGVARRGLVDSGTG